MTVHELKNGRVAGQIAVGRLGSQQEFQAATTSS